MGILVNLLAALMFSSSTPAVAPNVPSAPVIKSRTVDDVIPEKYQGGSGILRVYFAKSRYEVENLCNDFDPNWITYACYWSEDLTGKGKDYIVSPNPCDYPEAKQIYSYAHLMCHEKAHKNGWSHK